MRFSQIQDFYGTQTELMTAIQKAKEAPTEDVDIRIIKGKDEAGRTVFDVSTPSSDEKKAAFVVGTILTGGLLLLGLIFTNFREYFWGKHKIVHVIAADPIALNTATVVQGKINIVSKPAGTGPNTPYVSDKPPPQLIKSTSHYSPTAPAPKTDTTSSPTSTEPFPPADPDDPNFPWTKVIDQTSKNYYYFNNETGESVWKKPTEWIEPKN